MAKPLPRNATTTPAVDGHAMKTTATLAVVPPMHEFDTYVSRVIVKQPKPVTDLDVLTYAHSAAKNVLLEGPTGSGKTSGVLAYAAKNRHRFYSVSSSVGLEPSQLFGKFIPNSGGASTAQFVWQDGPVTDLVRHGGVLLLNEVNFIPERVGTVLFSLLDKRREIQLVDNKGEVIRAHRPNCWCDESDCSDKWLLIVADMNPNYEGTRPMNKAFRNRFPVQMVFDYSSDIERKLIWSTSLLKMFGKFRSEAAAGAYDTPMSTNMMMEFQDNALGLGVEFAVECLVSHFADDERQAARLVIGQFASSIATEVKVYSNPSSVIPKSSVGDKPTDEADFAFFDDDTEVNDILSAIMR